LRQHGISKISLTNIMAASRRRLAAAAGVSFKVAINAVTSVTADKLIAQVVSTSADDLASALNSKLKAASVAVVTAPVGWAYTRVAGGKGNVVLVSHYKPPPKKEKGGFSKGGKNALIVMLIFCAVVAAYCYHRKHRHIKKPSKSQIEVANKASTV